MTTSLILVLAAFVPMLAEATLSRRNERVLRAAGAVEPEADVYRVMQVAYPGSFLLMVLEGAMRQSPPGRLFVAGALVFAVAKALKYWAIASLGPRWTFRVLVLPDVAPVTSGPYRYMRHPNYAGVVGEIVGGALMAGAPIAGTVAVLGFGGLLLARVRIEERAMEAGRAR
jgi:methyltransferase